MSFRRLSEYTPLTDITHRTAKLASMLCLCIYVPLHDTMLAKCPPAECPITTTRFFPPCRLHTHPTDSAASITCGGPSS